MPKADTDGYSPVAAGILQGLREALAYQKGELPEAKSLKVYRAQKALEEVDVKTIRTKLGLSQSQFAAFIHSTPRAVQHWEQHTRKPDGPTLVLLKVLSHNPNVVWKALRAT